MWAAPEEEGGGYILDEERSFSVTSLDISHEHAGFIHSAPGIGAESKAWPS